MQKNYFLLLLISFSTSCLAQRDPCNPTGESYNNVPGDTTIVLPSGSEITFNRCEYFDIRDCIKIVEITDTADLRASGLPMYDSRGQVLLTCGMISVSLSDCGKSCFEVPIKIRVKIRFEDCSGETPGVPNLYTGGSGSWIEVEKNKSKIVTVNNIKYIEFESNCSVMINCDVPKRARKVKIIAPKGNKIEQVRIGRNCPLFYADDHFLKLKRKQKVKMLCGNPANTSIQARLVNSEGNKKFTPQEKLSALKTGKRKIPCKATKRTFLGRLFDWKKRNKGDIFKKYYLPA
jgi:hypothetical protein